MNAVDRLLQRWRIARAEPWIRRGDRLLDVGCFDLSLLARVEDRLTSGVGIDTEAKSCTRGRLRMIHGRFPDDVDFEPEAFDCITLLAVLEHVGDPEALARHFFRLLAPGGRAVLTVPSAAVDPILDVLQALRVIDGMDTEAHHAFDVEETVPIFQKAGFRLLTRRTFQLGLNHLFVFEKSV